MNLKVTTIIPTKDRPDALAVAVRSLCAQTVAVHSLMVVDQSTTDESRRALERELSAAAQRNEPPLILKYIHDATIRSVSIARNRAMAAATGDIWLFLDDDVHLEPDFIEQLLVAYRDRPEATGISGIITNYERPSLAFRLWSGVFVRGPFHDPRQPIYWQAEHLRMCPLIRLDRFTGAAMSFRMERVRDLRFDEHLAGVSDGEDVDFCLNLGPDAVLLVCPQARLRHLHSPVGRLTDHWLRRYARGNLFLYHKHWKNGWLNRLYGGWLQTGYSTAATIASCRRLALAPWRALKLGEREAAAAAGVVERTPRQRMRDCDNHMTEEGPREHETAGPAQAQRS